MSVERITAGLRQRERERGDDVIPISGLRGAPRTISDLNTIANEANVKAKRLTDMAAGIERALDNFEAQKRAEFDGLGKVKAENDVVTDSIGDDRRRKMLADTMRAKRKEVLGIGAEDRARLSAELDEMRQRVASVSAMWEDPVAILKRTTWGSEKVDLFRRDLAASGPVEIENAPQTAVITDDRELAAAALQRLDAMPKAQRDSVRVNRRELAETLVADEWRRARVNILATELAVESASIALAQAEGRSVPSSRKIELGIRRREFQALHGEAEQEDAA